MLNDAELELFRQHSAAMDKYRYFLLAAAGASIAFAVTQTQNAKLSLEQIPLGLAVVCWGASFYLGCVHVDNLLKSYYTNMTLEQVRSGKFPSITDPVYLQIAIEEGYKAFKKQGDMMQLVGRWQFRTLISGAILFIVWHVLQMAHNASASLVSP